MNPYQGSPSLSPDAREKVLQTFRHTLALAQGGRNEEALLGCDFILKMDARFAPARRLLESLRGVPVGTAIDVSPFEEYTSIESAGEALPEAAEEPSGLPPAEATPAVPGPAAAPTKPAVGLSDVVFDDFASADPFGGNLPLTFSTAAGQNVKAPPATVPEPPPPASAPPGLGKPGLSSAPDLTAPPFEPGPPPKEAPPPGTARPPSSPSQTDPRITQFLRQGDEALARGNPQEAIDLWSRVFLIDLANEEASKRIDTAREAQATTARKIDALLSEGIQQYDGGDLQGARNKFLDVLALSETDATARSYLNQIDTALSPKNAAGAGPAADSDFLKNELEAPHMPSYAPEEDSSLEMAMSGSREVPALAGAAAAAARPETAAARRGGLDIRILIGVGVVVLAAVAFGTYWFLRRPAARVSPPPDLRAMRPAPAKPAAPKEDLIAKAQGFFDQGKVDEAIQVLLAVPDNDPRRNEAIAKIDQFRQAAPTPVPAAAARPANLEELRATGFAALKASRYIDAVKALDPVAKARPEDLEATQALAKANEKVKAFGSALKSYNEADYETAIKLLWELRKQDEKNQDVEEYLLNSYVNSGIQNLQAGNMAKATSALQDALQLRPGDPEARRLFAFAKKYQKGASDLLARTFVKHLVLRQ
jgi:tetratricopeptide (TPR) repeat protein